ncbi:response regulator transcription factor [Tepidamorphus sp. 3E244]|uniref:response regulator transcription factor n=1 Tax=Tepidamorphus sp. 3E244 TaxID=3385498 RepID=UPI0038FC34A8
MKKTVLVAEDEPNIVESLSFLLERAGFDVTVEPDGRNALDAALANVPDVLILDVMLPSMDGYEILRQLRADARCKSLPVVMLTAKGQREDRDTAMESGADLFITKPFSNKEIVAAVESLVSGRQAVSGG